mmetsp:Transcript_25938/g.47414  ORF Transcript_25938/g.47414 Transcript_25938/m.47414 type:complete len:287 (-) Transcript_25938:125-985(-)
MSLASLVLSGMVLLAAAQPPPPPEGCSIELAEREVCGTGSIDRRECEDMGCCWQGGGGSGRRRRTAGGSSCYQRERDHRRIICPFLSTLINEGVLPRKDSYTREELQEITIQAGLSENVTIGHVEANFLHNPAGVQDIFNMEGAANEHITSTGVHDCATFYYDCSENAAGVGTCKNTTLECELPNANRFEAFFSAADSNGDLVLTSAELTAFSQGYPDIIDANPLRVSGSIEGSHQAILMIFGSPLGESISKDNLRRLFIDRQFPSDYTFPEGMRRLSEEMVLVIP